MDLSSHWTLDPSVVFLNHGSFGACPRAILELQSGLRAELEREPVQFFLHSLEPRLDAARASLAAFVGAEPSDLAFVPNATAGINSVLRSLRFSPGDELLISDHAYNATRQALEFVAQRAGAKVVVAHLPFPLAQVAQAVEPILAAVTARTRLAVLDHVTSPTGLVLPLAETLRRLSERGVETLVDGAHAPGMVDVDLRALGATYYTGNCHKWLCSPKVAGFLYVRRDRQPEIRPLAISHGANSRRTDRSRFLLEFDWTGTWDFSPYLCVPEVLRYLQSLVPGGWPELRRLNREKALGARRTLCAALDVPPPAPDEMIGSLAAVPLPNGSGAATPLEVDPLQRRLKEEFSIEVPIFAWPEPPRRLLRLSAHLYNAPDDYQKLASALTACLRS